VSVLTFVGLALFVDLIIMMSEHLREGNGETLLDPVSQHLVQLFYELVFEVQQLLRVIVELLEALQCEVAAHEHTIDGLFAHGNVVSMEDFLKFIQV
jgi:hypothetical protein